MKNPIRILIVLVVICALVLPRLADLAVFTAADEPFWLAVGANYYYALTHREFENTVYEYHPAVTTMWIVTGAMLIYFPEYRALMNGYFQQEKTSFDTYLIEHGKDPLSLLWWSRLIQTLINVFLWLTAFLFLRHLLDEGAALAILLIASFAPYLFGQSRMLNHESMVGLFSLNAILAISVYLFKGRRLVFLILSAIAAALANLTKSSSIALLPVIALIILTLVILELKEHKKGWNSILDFMKIYSTWLVLVIAFYIMLWPGMWVAPGKMLYEVYGNAFSYAFLGSRLSVSGGLEPASFNLSSAAQGISSILTSMEWRTSPVTWLGLLLAVLLFLIRKQQQALTYMKWLISFLLLEAIATIAMFGVISGRDSPHYVLVAYICLETTAAMGWVGAIRWLGDKIRQLQKPLAQAALLGAVFIFQAVGLISFQPYYYTYHNPLLRLMNNGQFPIFFYGEKMEQAAAYLAGKPEAQYMTALVYFGRSFSYYFPGDTLLFKPVFFEDKAQLADNLRRSDYLVVYAGLEHRLPILQEMTPEHIIYLNGRPYVEVYRSADVPASIIEN